MSLWSKLAQIAGVAAAPFTGGASAAITAGLGAAGAALGSAADASASNRSTALDYELQRERLNQDRQNSFVQNALARDAALRSGQASDEQAARRAEFLANGAPGRPSLTPYYASQAISDATKASNAAYANDLRGRVANAESRLPQVKDPGAYTLPQNLTKAGTFERIAGVAAPIATVIGAAQKVASAPPSAGPVSSRTIAGMPTTSPAELLSQNASGGDPLAALRASLPELNESQVITIAEALRKRGVRF